MANALTSQAADLQANVIHQFLHGYSEGHRLIEGSLTLPNDIARLMLRMSDLSGSSVVKGFDQYVTGYPLDSINAYALAMTWYAPEMPRPGCVWTHTLALPVQATATIPYLTSLIHLFKRPKGSSIKGKYGSALTFDVGPRTPQSRLHSEIRSTLGPILSAYYGLSRYSPIVLAARDSDEFTDAILALWSQQWPSLRRQFAFCTGSLSARSLPDRAFDIQCVPLTLAKDVAREVAPDNPAEAVVVVSGRENIISEDLSSAIDDALIPDGGPFRHFLWTVADTTSNRADFASYVKLFDAFNAQTDALTLVELIADIFPQPSAGNSLKAQLFESRETGSLSHDARHSILRALATTDKYRSFDSAFLRDGLIAKLFTASPESTRRLVSDLFRSSLNPLGDEILSKLVRAMDADDARQVISAQPQLLPAIFRANPDLAASPQLWSLAGDRKRELLDSLVAQEICPELVSRIVFALLDSGSDGFIRRAIERWGRDAVFAALDWIENHQGQMSETSRGTLTFNVPDVMSWVESGTRSVPGLVAAAHVVAPYPYQIAKHDSTVWLPALKALQESGNQLEATYIQTLLLALGLCSAPPAPLDLIAECFETIHEKAELEQLRDDAWVILQPLVPELHWWNNWDKCERMRRGLLLSFMQHSWPPWELKERIKNRKILRELLNSAHNVNGDHYFRSIHA